MFETFISLGCYCGVACSMSKNGLRSFSGPFDWYISEFHGVLECLQSDFESFLKWDNLEEVADEKCFIDIKHNFYYNHEIITSLRADYNNICEKYKRRINNFRQAVTKPSCFIRSIDNTDELQFIINNIDYIDNIIKKSNIHNEIIYIVSNELKNIDNFKAPFFVTNFTYHNTTYEELRCIFDSNADLIKFFMTNIDKIKRNANLIFDLRKENKRLETFRLRYNLLVKLEESEQTTLNIDTDTKIIIYGAGYIGKYLYNKINKAGGEIPCFIDEFTSEREYKHIPIIRRKEISRICSSNEKYIIIITIPYAYNSISEEICGKFRNLKIVKLDEILI